MTVLSPRAAANGPKERLAFLLPDLRGGGAERVALTITREFVALGYEVDLVLVRAEGELLGLLPPEVKVVDLGARRLVGALPPLIRYLRRRRPHAVQVRMWPLTVIGIIAGVLARSKTRVVVSDHVALSEQYGHLPRIFRLLRRTVRIFYPLADVRLLVSEGAADDLAQISGIRRDKFEVVYNPTPAMDHIEIPPEVEALWGGGGARLISAGALKQQKNHALLIRAFARLRRRREAKLMILGQGALLPELQALARAEGVFDEVIFAGFKPDPWPYMASADLFVLSSDYEGFGNVLVEALRLGVDAVSTDCRSGPAEILGHGRFGGLAPCGDADALALAMEIALDHPIAPTLLKARAEEISGRGAIRRYLELMLGRACEAAPPDIANSDPVGS